MFQKKNKYEWLCIPLIIITIIIGYYILRGSFWFWDNIVEDDIVLHETDYMLR